MTIFESILNSTTAHKWTAIIIHHSATPDGKFNDWSAIRRWHMGEIGSKDESNPDFNPYTLNPMKDIGYHAGIELVDNTLVYKLGRSLDMAGAHTIGMNRIALGICLVGNYDVAEPDYSRYFMLASLCRAFMSRYNIKVENIYPHNAYANKTCPGSKFDMNRLKLYIESVSV